MLFDTKTRSNLLQWPVEEVETLRKNATDLSGITIDYGSVFPLNLHRATQLDIIAEFELDRRAVMAINEADVGYNCSTSGGSANRGALGPSDCWCSPTSSTAGSRPPSTSTWPRVSTAA